MIMRDKDFLDEFVEDEATELPVEQIERTEEVEPAGRGPVRGPDGKFIKAEARAQAEAVEKGAKEAAGEMPDAVTEPPSDDEESGTVPLSVVKALRKELQELKKAQGSATQTQRAQTKAPDVPGPSVTFEQDPRTYIEQALFSQKTHISRVAAAQQYGADLAEEAWTAFVTNNDPLVVAYSHQLAQHPHPVGEMVKWYQEQQELRAIREAGGIENLIAQRMAGGQMPATSQQKPNVPPSLAGTGKPRSSDNTGDPVDGFDALFKR
jgi:hypothetical protein